MLRPEGDPPLTGEAIGLLTTEIQGAFSVDELDELILLTFSEGLYAEYVPGGQTGHYTTIQLIAALLRRGTLSQFLRAVRKARPYKASLLNVIHRFCPIAMDDAPPDSGNVNTVITGLITLDHLRNVPAVGALIASSRADLVLLAEGLKKLRAYKALHDILQKIQIQQYRKLVEDIGRLRSDPAVGSALGIQILALKFLCEDARQAAEDLEDNPTERSPESRWIGVLDTAVKELDMAVEEIDDLTAKLATSTIGDLIREHPPRVNGLLRGWADRLPLKGLILTVEAVNKIASVQADQKELLVATKEALEQLLPRLRGSVAEHDHWQDVETQLSGADSEIERQHFDDFGIYWTKAKRRIESLWNLDPTATWIISTKAYKSAVDVALVATPIDVSTLKQSYARLRNEALLRFYLVDKALGKRCLEILRISEPLSRLLNG